VKRILRKHCICLWDFFHELWMILFQIIDKIDTIKSKVMSRYENNKIRLQRKTTICANGQICLCILLCIFWSQFWKTIFCEKWRKIIYILKYTLIWYKNLENFVTAVLLNGDDGARVSKWFQKGVTSLMDDPTLWDNQIAYFIQYN